jgi:lipoate---protein ligase
VGALSGRTVPHCLTATATPGAWPVERFTGSAAELLGPWPPAASQGSPVVRTGRVTGVTTLVLGSTQDRAVVDDDAVGGAGIEVVRRSTGGGAVLVAPGAQVWIDLWLPRGQPLWDDDVVRAAGWVGDAWAQALGRLGATALEVHRGPATGGGWSRRVCFAGLGPGELHIGGRKVMGLAQRRTRAGARFHTTAPLVWRPALLSDLLAVDPAVDGGDDSALDHAALGLRQLIPAWSAVVAEVDIVAAAEDAVLAALPATA